METITWVLDHWSQVMAALVAAHFVAQVVVNLTSTPKDNARLSRIYKAVEVAAGIVSRTAKQLPGEPGNQRRTS